MMLSLPNYNISFEIIGLILCLYSPPQYLAGCNMYSWHLMNVEWGLTREGIPVSSSDGSKVE